MTAPVGSVRVTIDGDGSGMERALQDAVKDAMAAVQRELSSELLKVGFETGDLLSQVRDEITDAQNYADANPITVHADLDTGTVVSDFEAMRTLLQAAATPITQTVRLDVDRGDGDTTGIADQTATWRIVFETAEAVTQLTEFRDWVREQTTTVAIPVTVDGTQARLLMDLLLEQLRRDASEAIPIPVTVDIDTAAALAAARTELAGESLNITAKVDLEVNATAEQLAALREIRKLADKSVKVKVELDMSEEDAKRLKDIGPALRSLRTLTDKDVKIKVTVDMSEEERRRLESLGPALRSLRGLSNKDVRIKIDLQVDEAQLQRLVALLRELRSRSVRVNVDDSDVDRANSNLGRLGSTLGSLGGAVGGIAGVTAALAGIAGAAGLAAGAIGGIAIAGLALAPAFAAGIATITVGLQGMKSAFDAVAEASDAGPKEAAAQAKQVASAVAQVTSAEKSVQSAKRASRDAEQDLTRARKDAVEQLEDLNLELRGAALSERDAELSLLEARQDLAQLDTSSTALERERAVLRVQQAEQRLLETQERNGDLAAEADEANRKGIEDSDLVVAAKERLQTANEGVATAETQLAAAQAALADAQNAALPSTEKLNEALAKLSPNAQAFVLAARELAPAWENVRKSVQDNLFQGLSDTLTNVADAVLPSLEAGMGSVATELNLGTKGFGDFLASAEGVAGLDAVFANTTNLLRGMREGSDGFLAGLSQMTQAATPFTESLGRAVGSIGTELGAAFSQIADSGLLGEVLGGLTTALEGAGPLLRDLVISFAELGAKVLPALKPLFEAIGQAVLTIAPTLGDIGAVFARSLAEIMPDLASFVDLLLRGLEPILPVLVGLMKSLLAAIEPLVEPLASIAITVGEALISAIDALAPSIGPLADAFAAIVAAAAPLVPLIAEGLAIAIDALAPALTEVANALAPVIADFSEQMRPVLAELAPILAQVAGAIGTALAGAIAQIAPVLPDIVSSFADLLLAILPLMPELVRMAAEILPPLIDIFVQLAPTLVRVIDLLTWLVENVIIPLVLPALQTFVDSFSSSFQAVADLLEWWNGVVDTVFGAVHTALDALPGWFDAAVTAIGVIWQGLEEKAKVPVRFVVNTVWNDGLRRAWNNVARFIGVDELEPVTLGFARGGVLPGYTPGRDTHHFVSVANPRVGLDLSGGEGIARPEVVRALGSSRWDAMNAAARTGGVSGVQRFFGFASGGVIPTTMWRLIKERFPEMQFTSGLRTEGNDFHTRNMAGDFATPEVPSAAMKATARWIFENYGPESLELIHWPLDGWQNIDEGKPFNFGDTLNEQHRSHVHWAMDHPPGEPGDKPGGILSSLREGASRLFGSIRDRVADIFDAIVSTIQIPEFPGLVGKLPRAFFDTFRAKMRGYITGRADDEDSKTSSVPTGGDVEMWRPLVRDLLSHYDLPLALTNSTLRRMGQESGGRTDAVNLWDENAKKGTPSVGLMQIIRPNYEVYADPAFDKGPYLYGVSIDPAANISSSFRYVNQRYMGRGSTWGERLQSAYDQAGGYQSGGWIPGVGSGDRFRALLEPGEFVVNRNAARRFGPMLRGMNTAVPRFQTGGDVGTVAGGAGTVPVAVTNWDGATTLVEALQTVANAGLDALSTSITTVLSDSLNALVNTTLTEAKREVTPTKDTELFVDQDQQRVDDQGQILSDTRDTIERTASSEAEVAARQFEEQQRQLNEILAKLTSGALIPIMEEAVKQGIGILQSWLNAGFEQVTDGTDRTTTAVENIDISTDTTGSAPFGSPGSAFDAVTEISNAVISVADTATAAFNKVASDVAAAALAQKPSKVTPSRGVLGKDISGGPVADFIVQLTGAEIEIRDTLIDTLDEIKEFRKDLLGSFDESGQLVSDTATLMQRNESSRDLVIAEQNRINRELIKAVLRYLVVSVLLPIISAILSAMISLAATAIGAAIGSMIPVVGTVIGAAIGALIGAALSGVAAVVTSALAIGAGAAIDSFDSGGLAHGMGLMVKATPLAERVLSPQETASYDRLGRVADLLESRQNVTTVNAPIYMRGGPRDADRVQDRLLTLMPK